MLKNLNPTYIVIDLETTGFHPGTNTIIEIGAILVDSNYEIIDTFETFVRTSYIPSFISQLTGITLKHVINAPALSEVMQQLSSFAKGAIPIAHNASFDKRFTRYFLESTSTEFTETEWIDSIGIFKDKFPGMKNYKLNTLIQHFGLATKEDHRALSDAMHTLTLLKK